MTSTNTINNSNATTTTTTNENVGQLTLVKKPIRMTKEMKAESYHTFIAIKAAVITAYDPREFERHGELVEIAQNRLAELVKTVRGIEVSGAVLFSRVLIRLVKETTPRSTGITKIKGNGIGSFNGWLKSADFDHMLTLEMSQGNDPSAKKSKSSKKKTKEELEADALQRALDMIKSMSEEERRALLAA